MHSLPHIQPQSCGLGLRFRVTVLRVLEGFSGNSIGYHGTGI